MKKILAAVLVFGLFPVVASATGLLVPTDGSLPPLGIKYHRASAKITDRVAVTHVDQVFYNSTDRDLEATYLFPLPKGATVSDFYLYINGKKTKGEILEKNRARTMYEGIVRRMRDPGLLEYLDRDLFQARIYPVPRRGEQRVEIEFTQMMPFEAGVMKYEYPMRTDRGSARTMQDFTMTVEIQSATPIKSLYSPSHNVYSRKKDDHHALAGFEKMAALLDRDFELFIALSEKDVGLNLLSYRQPGEPGFFMIMASPKSDYSEKEIIGKRISFVVDTSGSMSGEKLRYAKQALKYCLTRLNADDLFNVIRFSTDVESFEKQPVSASKDNVQRALNFVQRMEAAGGTAIDEALAKTLLGHTNTNEPNLVVFLTDGHPTVGETDAKRILAHVKKTNATGARVFVFGVGDDINTHLLDALSSENSADSTYVGANQEIEQRLSGFYDKVSHPVLANLALDFGPINEYDVFPRQLPDLFKGSQLIILGRYREDGHAALTLTGTAGKELKKFVYEGAFSKENQAHEFIPRLWATRKIGYLLDTIRLGGERRELVDEVVALSKRYGIVTPYTSYLVTEDTPQMAMPSTSPRPLQPRLQRPGADDRAFEGEGHSVQDSGKPSVMSAPETKRAESSLDMYQRDKNKAMSAESGASAVRMAEAVKELKKADNQPTTVDEAAGIRYVGKRSFRFQGGGWVDLNFKPGMETLRVKYLGTAYFEILKRAAWLRPILSLGNRVTVAISDRYALVVEPEGRDPIPDAELSKFVP
jgi:Ca-activated chloride channel family protein